MRESTALNSRDRVTNWLFLTLGDVPVNEVTGEQIGGVIRTIREAGRSSAIRRGVSNPLCGMYTQDREQNPAGPNPCAD